MLATFNTRTFLRATWLLWCMTTLSGAGPTPSLLFDHDTAIAAVLPNESLPIWSWGSMVRVQNNASAAPVVSAFDEHGTLVASAAVGIPGAYRIVVSGFARAPEGTLVVCGWSADESGRLAGFIAMVGSSSTTRVIRTNPYFPQKIAVASDGSLWTASEQIINGRESKENYDVLRHYDLNGTLLGSAIPRLSLSSKMQIAGNGGRMAASLGRVGWYTGPLNGKGSEYVEVRQDGNLLRIPGVTLAAHEHVTGLALTDAGAFVSTENSEKRNSAISTVDETSRTWLPVTVPGGNGPISWLYGGDGNRVVATGNDSYGVKFFRLAK